MFKVKVILRLAVYRLSVHLGAKTLEVHDQRFFQLNPWSLSLYVTLDIIWTMVMQVLLWFFTGLLLCAAGLRIVTQWLKAGIEEPQEVAVARQRQVHTRPHQQNTQAIGRQQPTYTSRNNRGLVGNDVFLCGSRIRGWMDRKLGLGTVTKKTTVIQVTRFSRLWLLRLLPSWLGHGIVLWSDAGVSE
jgi:hypothetical protein